MNGVRSSRPHNGEKLGALGELGRFWWIRPVVVLKTTERWTVNGGGGVLVWEPRRASFMRRFLWFNNVAFSNCHSQQDIWT